jgi:hypothetical protein
VKYLTIEVKRLCNVKTNVTPLKIVQKIPEQHNGKARNQETTENSHTGHCTQTSESTSVETQNVYNEE